MATTGRSVADVMTTDPVVIDSGASLEVADIVLRTSFNRGIPVVDGEGRLVGTIGDAISSPTVADRCVGPCAED